VGVRPRLLFLAVLAAPVVAAACGGTPLPPPAAPAASPALDARPAGRLLAATEAAGAPHAADPARAGLPGGRVAVLDSRERVLRLRDARTGRTLATAPAGVGPTHVVAAAPWVYVVDTRGGALLVYTTAPRLEPVRRVFLPGSPYGIAVDPERMRLWVALTARNRLVELPAHGRPHAVRELPTLRRPVVVAVGPGRGPVYVRRGAAVQAVDPEGVDDR
jgi:DNA-binding beta-propeller fold protein YncE